MTAQTHRQRILHRLERGGSLTKVQGLELFGCLNTGGRICELRQMGHQIETKMVRVKTRDGRMAMVASYRMAK